MDMEDAPMIDNNSNGPKIEEGPLLQIPCSVIVGLNEDGHENASAKGHPLQTMLDTSLPTSQMSWQAAKKNGLLDLVVKDDKFGRAYIPAALLWLRMGSLEATVHAPAILVVKDQETEFDLRLGVDFLRDNKGVIDLREEELNILVGDESIMIPFLRPRASLSFGEDL
jgi:hypothetical protein